MSRAPGDSRLGFVPIGFTTWTHPSANKKAPKTMTPAQADLTAERLLQAVRREPVTWNGHMIHCTISIGYASFPMAGSATDISLDSAISLVDKALYVAKRRGRDRACLIKVVSARDDKELTKISSEFETATRDRRVELVEILGAAA